MWIGGVSLAAIVIASIGWAMRGQIAYARIATSYAAKQTCSCLHISGRTMDSCIADFPEDARDAVTVTQDGDRVHASVLFGAIGADAVHDGEYGCRVVD
jgi:hypothetical protein